jgi:hypothetical protein
MSTTQTWRKCIFCQGLFIEPDIAYMADPFRQEVYGEQARMWICSKCQKQRRVELKNKGKKVDLPPEPAPKKDQTDKVDKASKVREAKLNEITEQLDRIEEELKKIRKAIREVT